MNRLFTVLSLAFIGLIAANCNKDDSSGGATVVPIRDRAEVRTENEASIEAYLKSHYIKEEGDIISFETIKNSESSIWNDPRLVKNFVLKSDMYDFEPVRNQNGSTSLKYTKPKDELEYKVYYLVINEGKGKSASTIDSTYVKLNNLTLRNEEFNPNFPGKYYSFPTTPKDFMNISNGQYSKVPGQLRSAERQLLTKIKTATGIKTDSEGLPTYDEGSAGRIIAFIPSGLGYFNAGAGSKLKGYESYIADLTLINTLERDHDGDGILSKYEVKVQKPVENLTLEDYFSFDTDGDGIPNFLDDDDDGDGVLTKTELFKERVNGVNIYYNFDDPALKNCNDIPRYLDKSCFPDQKDGEITWPKK